MANPTQRPEVFIKYERNGVVRAMFVSPFPENQEATSEFIINRLRVYHATHPAAAGGLTFLADVTLTYVAATTTYELTFTPGRLGVFAFSFVNAKDEEGPLSNVAKVVYAPFTRVKATFLSRCLGTLSDSDIFDIIADSSDLMEMYTDMRFYPLWLTKLIDGSNAYDLPLDEAIVEITQVRHRAGDGGANSIFDPARYRVYNRHIAARNAFVSSAPTKADGWIGTPGDGTGGLTHPDDREAPRLSLVSPNEIVKGRRNTRYDPVGFLSNHRHGRSMANQLMGFASGRQNIVLDGFFGYTAPDLSTPAPLAMAVELLTIRSAVLRFGTASQARNIVRDHRLIMEKTDGHTVMFKSQDPLATSVTGDPLIDQIIARYHRPFGIAVV